MTRIVIVGEMFYSDLSIGGGPMPPSVGQGGQPSHPIYRPGYPDQGLPGGGGSPSHPIYHPGHPDHGLPSEPPYPDQGLPGGAGGYPSHPIHRPGSPSHPIAGYPDQGLPPGQPGEPSHPIEGVGPGPGHPWVPPSGEALPPPPEDIADNTVVAVWKPEAQAWSVTVYEAAPH